MSLSIERITLEKMIQLYCRKHHHHPALCPECSQLLAYAEARLEKCPFGADKPTCQNCTVHCYSPEMRQKIKEVMRFSGPRMILYHPLLAVRHLLHNQQSQE